MNETSESEHTRFVDGTSNNSKCSVQVAIVLACIDGGELCATIGIEGNAEVLAESSEFRGIEQYADGISTLSAGLLFPLFCTLKPMGVQARQKVTVFHHGLDLGVLVCGVPTL